MVLASRGLRENEDGSRSALDAADAAPVRRRAARVWALVAVATAAVSILLLLIPRL